MDASTVLRKPSEQLPQVLGEGGKPPLKHLGLSVVVREFLADSVSSELLQCFRQEVAGGPQVQSVNGPKRAMPINCV